MIHIPMQAFPLGMLVITRRAQAVLDQAKESAWTFLFRHGAAEWEPGDERFQALEEDRPIVSVFTTATGRQIVVRTDADRGRTTIMLKVD